MEVGTAEVHPSARCRLCAAHEAIKVDIFGDEGRSRKLGEKIQTCLPIKVGTEDRLPKSLCYRCMYLLEKFYDFRQCCLNASEMLEVCVEEFEARAATAAAATTPHAGRFETLEQQLSHMKMEVQNDVMPTLEVQTPRSASVSRSNSASSTGPPLSPLPSQPALSDPAPSSSPPAPSSSPPAPSSTPLASSSTPLAPSSTPPASSSTPLASESVVASTPAVASTSQSSAPSDGRDVIDLDGPDAASGPAPPRPTPAVHPRKLAPAAGARRDKIATLVKAAKVATPTAKVATPTAKAATPTAKPVPPRRDSDEDVVDLTDDVYQSRPTVAPRSKPPNNHHRGSLLKETLIRNEGRSRKRSSSVEIEELAVVSASAKAGENVANGEEEGSSSRRKNAKPRKIARTDEGAADEDKPFSCMLCSKAFTLKNALSRHFNACHGVEINDLGGQHERSRPSKVARPDYETDIECIEVDEDSSASRDSTLLYCEICMRSFNDKSSLWLHLMYSHKDAAPYACGLCLKLFRDNASLARHWKGHYTENNFRNEYFNMERRYSCEICGRQDNSRKKLTNHMRIHVFDSSFDPDMLIIVNADYYNAERRRFDFADFAEAASSSRDASSSCFAGDDVGGSGSAYLPCERCYKAFETEEALAKHRKTAHRTFVDCQVCGETFDTEEKLMSHVTSEHFDGNHMLAEQPTYNPFEPVVDFSVDSDDAFYCKYCSQQFATMREVERHQRGCKSSAAAKAAKADACSHHCEMCKKSFISEDCLVKHKKGAHKLDASLDDADATYNSFYFCEFCGTSHETKVARWRHVNAAHADEPAIRCDQKSCGKIFAAESLCVEHRSHHNVQGAYPNTCELCGKLWHSRVEYWKHIQGVHAEMLPFICGICLKMFCDTSSLVGHVRLTHKLQKGSHHCSVCARPYSNQSKCARHEAIHGGEAAAVPPPAPAPAPVHVPAPAPAPAKKPPPARANLSKSENLLWCDLCPQIANFPSVYALANHRRAEHSLHPCDLCTKFYGRNSHLWKHVNKKHRGNSEIMCNICMKVSATKTQLTVHFKKIHKMDVAVDAPQPSAQEVESAEANSHILTIPSFQVSLPSAASRSAALKQYVTYDCKVCSKPFIKRYLLRKHLSFCLKRSRRAPPSVRMLSGLSAAHPCDVCGVEFDTRSRLSDHARSHHKTNACSSCADTFVARAALLAHVSAAHPDLRCPTCGKCVRTREDLEEHSAQHATHEYPPYCELCGEVVSNRVRIWHHFNSYHKEDIPYLCGVCFVRQPDTPALKAHVEAAHPGATDVEKTCKVCAKGYSSVYKVLEHVNKYHAGYVGCKECLNVFESHKELKRHVMEVHGKDLAMEATEETLEKVPSEAPKSANKSVEVSKGANKAPEVQKGAERTPEAKAKAPEREPSPRQRSKRSYACDKCPVTFSKPSELNAHRRRQHFSSAPLVAIPGGALTVKDEVMDEEDGERKDGEDEEEDEDEEGDEDGGARRAWVACRVCLAAFETAQQLTEHHLEGCASLNKRRRVTQAPEEGEETSLSEDRTEGEEEGEGGEESSGMPVLKPNRPVASRGGGGKGKTCSGKEMPDLEVMPKLSPPPGDGLVGTSDESGDGEVGGDDASKSGETETECSNDGTARANSDDDSQQSSSVAATAERSGASSDDVELTTEPDAIMETGCVEGKDEGSKSISDSERDGGDCVPSTNNNVDGGALPAVKSVDGSSTVGDDCLNSLEDALDILEAQNS